jgi:carboxylesterase
MALIGIGVALTVGMALAVWARRRNRTRYETGTFEADAGQIMPGAEPVSYEGHGRGVVILHGFGDTPQSVRALATHLHDCGWAVRAPLLSGHGGALRMFTGARADDWLADARTALREMHARCPTVAIVGQSMGGALATILAAESRVEALVLLAPYMRLSRRAAWIGRFHFVASLIRPYLRSRSESSILDPAARGRALGRGLMTPRLVHELSRIVHLARRAAPRVRVPTLVIHSPQDPRVKASNATAAFADLGSETKVLEWATQSGHVLSVDYDRDWVASRVAAWLEAYAPRA